MGLAALLVSDVDHTLLGDEVGLVQFADWYSGVRGSIRLAYNSGRFYESVEESVRSSLLPEPDVIIGGVGTDIRFTSTGASLEDWPEPNGWDPDRIEAVLRAHEELKRQPDHLLSQYKISYYGCDLSAGFLNALRHELRAAGQQADVVYSSRRDLDVLPSGVNKGSATARLADHWQFESSRVVVAGDSGNDLSMFQFGFRGIVVGNAHEELKSLTGQNIYHAHNECAAGVLEGMKHWLQGRC